MLQKTQKVAGGVSHSCKLDAEALCGLSNYVSQGLVRESGIHIELAKMLEFFHTMLGKNSNELFG